MEHDPISPLAPQRSYSTEEQLFLGEKQIACGTAGLETVQCNPYHVCRVCRACWNVNNTLASSHERLTQNTGVDDGTTLLRHSQLTTTKRTDFRNKCVTRYRKKKWLYNILLGVIIAAVVSLIAALAVVFHPRPPDGIYRNGAGLVALDRGDNSTMVDIFFHHASGQIRHILFNDANKQWDGYVFFELSAN